MSHCCPVGASPTQSKYSQQVGSKTRVHIREGVFEAG